MRKQFLNFVFKILNALTFKTNNSIFVTYGMFCKENCTDIINFTSANDMSLIREILNRKFKKRLVIYIEYYCKERMPEYVKISKSALENNIELRFVYRRTISTNRFAKFFSVVKRYYYLFKTKIWLISSGDKYMYGKLKSQTIINTNYFIPCKNDFIPGKNDRWRFLDVMLTTSDLASVVSAAQTGVRYDACIDLGFPRNDSLFEQKNKGEIYKWLQEELGYMPKKIIVYAPTYRDYEKNGENLGERELFGYPVDFLEEYLKKNKYCMICKLHTLATEHILQYPKGAINFKYCFDFSFYDLMSVSDCVITDYSSLGYDFLLLNKPIIYNLYDYDKYANDRGMSYEPYEDFCPGTIVTNAKGLKDALENLVNDVDNYAEKRRRLTRLFHKYPDCGSSKRVADYICERFKLI